MAGYIRLRKDLQTDPSFVLLCKRVSETSRVTVCDVTLRHAMIGALHYLWSYADEHVDEFDTVNLTTEELDAAIGFPGFCAAMPKRWLEVLPDGRIKLPKYREDNGCHAERQKGAALRQKAKRDRDRLKLDAASQIVTRESRHVTASDHIKNKEREAIASPKKDAPKRLPKDWKLSDTDRQWAITKGLTPTEIDEQCERFTDHWHAAPASKGTKLDWSATWRNWCREALARRQGGRTTAPFARTGRDTQESAMAKLQAEIDRSESNYMHVGEDRVKYDT